MNLPAICGAIALVAAMGSPVLANDGDAVRGGELFPIRCIECHAIGETTDKKIGPNLKGVIGRTSGSLEGYVYSDAMIGAGIVWSEETLKIYLVAPRKVVPGTKMNFNGLKRPGELEDIVAYLLEVGR
jgi:cytochrome c